MQRRHRRHMRQSLEGRVLVIGDLNLDVILGNLPRPPTVGDDVWAESFALTVGGSAAIVTSALASLGSQVTLFASHGQDLFSEFIVSDLEGRGAVVENLVRDSNSPTGMSVSFSDGVDRGFLSVRVPPAEWCLKTLISALPARHVHISSHPHIVGLTDVLDPFLTAVKTGGGTTSLDPQGPGVGRSPAEKLPAPTLIDVLFVNEQEAKQFVGSEGETDERLRQLAGIVVHKLGPRGARLFSGQDSSHVEGLSRESVDTTGAGDTFAGAFLYAWLEGLPVDRSLSFANEVAANSVTHLGGTATHGDLRSRFARMQRSI